MDARFGLTLLSVIILAVVVGLIAAQTQTKSVAAPVATVVPAPIPTPLPNHVDIIADPSDPQNGIFVPSSLTIQVGHLVIFVNRDAVAHSAVADNGAFNSGVISPGGNFTWTPKKVGRYEYSDFLYPNMHGAIEVVSFAVAP